MTPEALQTLGVLAIGLGFVLLGLGGFSTYHASQILQHQAELREAEQKGETNAQILTLLLKNQELQRKAEETATAQPSPAPAQPAASYYRPPAPPPPVIAEPPGASPATVQPQTFAPMQSPPPVGEGPSSSGGPPSADAPPVVQTPMPAPETYMEAPAETPLPRRAGDEGWHEPEDFEPDVSGKYLSAHQRHVIADTLRAHGRYTVKVESSYRDPVSREFAQELASAFAEADWLVRGIEEHRGLPLASGVTVSAGSFPPQQETRAMYEALLSAGIPVTQQLDPKQHDSETVVLVGAPL